MNPRELLLENMASHIAPRLSEIGFTYAPSQLTFRRKVDYARQRIVFGLSCQNRQDHCVFWGTLDVSAPVYKKWHEEKFGVRPVNVGIGGCSEWNVPGWSRDRYRAILTNDPVNDAIVMQELAENIERYGLPFLAKISTWEGAAERFLEERWFYHRAADFFLIAGQSERALATLLEGARQFRDHERLDQFIPSEREGLKQRLKLFFNVEVD